MSDATSTTRPRGRPPKLDADQVVDAALRVLDADGLGAVSMRRVAADLGVSHMTLYTYFPAKDHLLEALVARTLDVPGPDDRDDRPWDQRLTEAMARIRAALLRRPGIAETLVTHPLTGPQITDVRERLLALIEPAEFGSGDAVDAISILFNYTLGSVMVETNRGLGGSPASFELGLDLIVSGLRDRTARDRRR